MSANWLVSVTSYSRLIFSTDVIRGNVNREAGHPITYSVSQVRTNTATVYKMTGPVVGVPIPLTHPLPGLLTSDRAATPTTNRSTGN